MKNIVYITVLVFVLLPLFLAAQPQPWDPAAGGGTQGYPAGGCAPLGSGLLLMLSLAFVYAGNKFYKFRKKLN